MNVVSGEVEADAFSLLGWHPMCEKKSLKQEEYVGRPRNKKCTALANRESIVWGASVQATNYSEVNAGAFENRV